MLLTFGRPLSAMALSHWITLSVCLKWRPVAYKKKTESQNLLQKTQVDSKKQHGDFHLQELLMMFTYLFQSFW